MAVQACLVGLADTVFTRIDVTDGHVTGWEARSLFDELFKGTEFEYGSLVEVMPQHPNRAAAVRGPVLPLADAPRSS